MAGCDFVCLIDTLLVVLGKIFLIEVNIFLFVVKALCGWPKDAIFLGFGVGLLTSIVVSFNLLESFSCLVVNVITLLVFVLCLFLLFKILLSFIFPVEFTNLLLELLEDGFLFKFFDSKITDLKPSLLFFDLSSNFKYFIAVVDKVVIKLSKYY